MPNSISVVVLSAVLPLLAVSASVNTERDGDEAARSVPIELGAVPWGRDFDIGVAASRATGKPLLLLFQEIPGCQGCQDFGTGPLSHPLLVEAMETLFVPVAVNNRGGGADDELLDRFNEPRLNYPVARFLDVDGRDLIPRRDGVFTIRAFTRRLIAALEAAERDVPQWLRLVVTDATPTPASAVFSMHCFWEGEAQLGTLDGVVSTKAGWIGDLEVVEVRFDDSVLTSEALEQHAANHGCRPAPTGSWRDAKPADTKFHLGQSLFRVVPLTPAQSSRVNSALLRKEDPRSLMSPRQLAMFSNLMKLEHGERELLAERLASMPAGDLAGRLVAAQQAIARAAESRGTHVGANSATGAE